MESAINSHPDDESLLDTASESDTEAESVSTASETSFDNDGLRYCEYSSERLKWRKNNLKQCMVQAPIYSPGEDRQLCQLLCDYHDVFSLEEGE